MLQYILLVAVFHSHVSRAETTGTSCNETHPCPLIGGQPLQRCPELVSEGGHLNVVLRVQIGFYDFDWLRLVRRTYNNLTCSHTWRVKPGDTVNVTLINDLETGTHISETEDIQNTTNLHTHGLHISPLEPQDNAFVSVKPGESYQYSFKIIDDHAPGSYWYHPHHHESTTLQLLSGMAGMLIVEDDPNKMESELNAVSCPENCEHDISLVVSPMLLMASVIAQQRVVDDYLRLPFELENWLAGSLSEFAVNGQLKPVITLEKDQMTRFRFLHVGFVSPLELRVVDDDGQTAPCDMREIARDGVYFDRVKEPRLGQSVLHPGNRLDWLIKCTSTGTFKIFSEAKEEGFLSFGGLLRRTLVLATIDVAETRNVSSMDFPKTLPSLPSYLDDLRDVVPDQYISIEIGGDITLNREKWTTQTNYRFKVEVDSVVEVQMLSSYYTFSHPMHFHINHMQVIGYQPYTGPVSYYKFGSDPSHIWEMRDQDGTLCHYQHKDYVEGAASKAFNVTDPLKFVGHYDRWVNGGSDSLAYDQAGEWVDTFFSPSLSNITLRMKADRFTGPLLIHCHLPLDSDGGMMMVIEVVEKGADLGGANILSAGAAPGSCHRCEWNRYIDYPEDCISKHSGRSSEDVILDLLVMMMMITDIANNGTVVQRQPFDIMPRRFYNKNL